MPRLNPTNRWFVSLDVGSAVKCSTDTLHTRARQLIRVGRHIRYPRICGGQSGAGARFLRVLRFPCQSSFHQILHPHKYPGQMSTLRVDPVWTPAATMRIQKELSKNPRYGTHPAYAALTNYLAAITRRKRSHHGAQ
jgi:hypothetical protein